MELVTQFSKLKLEKVRFDFFKHVTLNIIVVTWSSL